MKPEIRDFRLHPCQARFCINLKCRLPYQKALNCSIRGTCSSRQNDWQLGRKTWLYLTVSTWYLYKMHMSPGMVLHALHWSIILIREFANINTALQLKRLPLTSENLPEKGINQCFYQINIFWKSINRKNNIWLKVPIKHNNEASGMPNVNSYHDKKLQRNQTDKDDVG